MDYARLGHTGLKVSRLCLGAMMLGRWGNQDHEDCGRIVRRAIDEGINFVDTANRYSMGESEEILGKALAGRRDEVVLATKVFMPGPGGLLDRGNSRRHVMLQVEESLRRCGRIGSISTRSIATTPRRRSKRRSARSPTASVRARCATSAYRPGRSPSHARCSSAAGGWSNRSGSPSVEIWSASCRRSRRTRFSPVRWSARCFRSVVHTGSAPSSGARSTAVGSRAATARDSPSPRTRAPRTRPSSGPSSPASST